MVVQSVPAMDVVTHTKASIESEIQSISSAMMDTALMVAHMQSVSIASGTDELTGLTNHQSANVSCVEYVHGCIIMAL